MPNIIPANGKLFYYRLIQIQDPYLNTTFQTVETGKTYMPYHQYITTTIDTFTPFPAEPNEAQPRPLNSDMIGSIDRSPDFSLHGL